MCKVLKPLLETASYGIARICKGKNLKNVETLATRVTKKEVPASVWEALRKPAEKVDEAVIERLNSQGVVPIKYTAHDVCSIMKRKITESIKSSNLYNKLRYFKKCAKGEIQIPKAPQPVTVKVGELPPDVASHLYPPSPVKRYIYVS